MGLLYNTPDIRRANFSYITELKNDHSDLRCCKRATLAHARKTCEHLQPALYTNKHTVRQSFRRHPTKHVFRADYSSFGWMEQFREQNVTQKSDN